MHLQWISRDSMQIYVKLFTEYKATGQKMKNYSKIGKHANQKQKQIWKVILPLALWNLPRNHKLTISQQITDNKPDLTENLGTGCHGQRHRDAEKRQKQKQHKEGVFTVLEKSVTTGGVAPCRKQSAIYWRHTCGLSPLFQRPFFDLHLMYVSQGSIHLAVAFTTGGTDAAVTTPSEEQMLFSSSSVQKKKILGSFGSVWGTTGWKGYLFLWLDFHVGKPEEITHLRIAIAWRVCLGGILSKAEAVSIN